MNKQKEQNNVLVTIVIILLVIIAVLWFFLGKNYNNTTNNSNTPTAAKNIKIKVIDDKRCSECQTDQILSQLKLIPSLSAIEVETKDFSDEGIEEYLKENNINTLPAIIFNANNIDSNINTYLTEIPSKEYSLQIWASFNPFIERSDRWFTILDKEKLAEIKESSYVKWNADAEITWLEYSDLECPYCAKLHNAGTPEDLTEKYGNKLNIVFNHFPLQFHNNALPWAQIAECLWETHWSDAFYKLIERSFAEENSKKSFLIDEAVKLWADEDTIKECLKSDKYEDKVTKQMETGASLFWITGTPGNILINNTTGEYEVISWAYPTSAFEAIIDKLLK